jgi:hypothetical protein
LTTVSKCKSIFSIPSRIALTAVVCLLSVTSIISREDACHHHVVSHGNNVAETDVVAATITNAKSNQEFNSSNHGTFFLNNDINYNNTNDVLFSTTRSDSKNVDVDAHFSLASMERFVVILVEIQFFANQILSDAHG